MTSEGDHQASGVSRECGQYGPGQRGRRGLLRSEVIRFPHFSAELIPLVFILMLQVSSQKSGKSWRAESQAEAEAGSLRQYFSSPGVCYISYYQKIIKIERKLQCLCEGGERTYYILTTFFTQI